MNLMNSLTIKNLKMNKKRTIVTIIGIILSVALITALSSLYLSLLGSLINFEVSEKGDYHLLVYDVVEEDINKYKNNINIDSMYYSKDIGYAKIDTKNDYKPYVFVMGITKDTLSEFPIKLIDGRMPTNDSEILIPSHLKTNGRVVYNIGDTITLNVGKRVLDGEELKQDDSYDLQNLSEEDTKEKVSKERVVETTKKQYTVVGIMERPSREIEPYTAPGYTMFTIIDSGELGSELDVYIKFKKNVLNDFEKVTYGLFGIDYEEAKTCEYPNTDDEIKACNKVNEKLKYGFSVNDYLIMLETDPIGLRSSGELIIVVGIVCLIIIVTSVYCIKNSFDISITEKTKQYGMLKSIGATKRQIRKNVLYEATILGLIGIPLGILSGFLASYILILVSNYYLKDMITQNFELCFTFSWISVIVAIILGVVTIYLSAIRSATKASKVSAIDSIRNNNEIKVKSNKMKSPKFVSKIFGIGGEISYKNLKRNKRKYRTTIISIIVSVVIFISLTALMNMALTSTKNDYQSNDYNISIYFNDMEIDDNTFNAILSSDAIDNYVITRHSGMELPKDRVNKEYKELNHLDDENLKHQIFYVNVQTLNKEKYMDYIKMLGLNYNDVKDTGILFDLEKVSITEKDANGKETSKNKYVRIFDYNKNDVITGLEFGMKENSKSVKVGMVTDKQPWGFTYNTSATLYVSEEYFNSNFDIDNTMIYFDSHNASKLQDDMEKILGDDEYEIYNNEESERMMRNFFTLLGIFLYGFIIVITLIGVTNIFNTITTNMELRKPEFAMLRSVGMTKKEFNNMIRLETLFMGVKALFFGITIGTILSYILHILLNSSSGLPYEFPINGIIISIVSVFLLITIIMSYSVRKIKKQNIIETIRNENI